MSYMTQIEGVPDTDAALPGMAFFSGTGPWGKMCGQCRYRGYHRENSSGDMVRTSGCLMFKKLSGGIHGPAVKKSYASCKYFEEQEKSK